MAGSQFRGVVLLFLYSQLCFQTLANPVNLPLHSVADSLFQSALNSLSENSPTHHTYKGGNLISAQKLVEPPYVVYRFTFNLNPVCKDGAESCPKEACTIDLRQHESGAIDIHRDSIQCLYMYPQSTQDDIIQVQESIQDASFQEQEYVENQDKQVNQSVELDHEIQPVADQSDRPFIAIRASSPNYCPGCPYELNPNLPGLLAFGEQITKSMDELLPNDFKHLLVRMIKVTRAVSPSNPMVEYHLLTEIGESDCLKNTLLDRSECNLQRNVPTKICYVTFEERPWTQDGQRITKNNCTLLRDGQNEPSGEPTLTSESLITTVHNTDQKQEGPSIFDIARDTLDEPLTGQVTKPRTDASVTSYDERQHSITEEPFVKTVLNKSQDDDKPVGFTDKIKEFDEFLEDFDLPIRSSPKAEPSPDGQAKLPVDEQIIKSKVEDRTERETFVRTKRSYFDVPSSEKSFANRLAQRAVDILDDMHTANNKKRIVLDTIVNSKERTSNGYLYELLLNVERTECNEKITGVKGCAAKIPQSIQVCRMEVSTDEDERIESARVMKSKCYKDSGKRSKRMRRTGGLVGSPTQKDVNDEEIIKFAQLGLRKFSENSEGTNEPIIVNITEATVQVVAGLKYQITVVLGNSDCLKGVKENCSLKSGSEMKECTITVWSRPWLDKESPEIAIDCNQKLRRTRSLRGVNYSQKMLLQIADLRAERMFEQFKRDYDKVYSSEKEERNRFNIFRKNLRKIDDLREEEQGTGEYGVTMFADLSYEEFRARHLGLRPDLRRENNIPMPEADIPNISIPKEFDWRQYGVVTPVKDQGSCGSCWAFSVTGNVEGQYAIKHQKLLSLSEQELVDCDKLDDGCGGGLPDNAYRAIEDIGGLELEKDYPYDAEDEKCHFNESKAKVQVVSAVNITSNETKMAQWLVQNGPISIGINANAMQFYVGGISHPFKFLCDPKNLDHGVLIVGYGIHKYPLFKKDMPYWTIKNSWGPRWGEQGYYRVYRGDGTCGVNQMASSAVVA